MAVRWAILGCGSIAKAFASAVQETPGAELAAVGSRSLEKARAFSAEYKSNRTYGTYEELARDTDVDAIYIATPHPFHCEHTLLCLEHGKHVLCEKPFALNAAQAREMVAKAREKNLFLMEAMWTRCFPIMSKVRGILAGGGIGKARMATADFGFRAGFDPSSRLFDPQLGGGALLDVGVYAISFASMVLGKPSKVLSMMTPSPTGVDGMSAYLLGHSGGELAVLYSAIEAQTPWEATVIGEEGRIRIHSPFWKPSKMTITTSTGEETTEIPFEGNGYRFEIEEVVRCLEHGVTESPVMPLDETISILETMDEIRGQWGLTYPGE